MTLREEIEKVMGDSEHYQNYWRDNKRAKAVETLVNDQITSFAESLLDLARSPSAEEVKTALPLVEKGIGSFPIYIEATSVEAKLEALRGKDE